MVPSTVDGFVYALVCAPVPVKDEFAALTIASTSCFVMSAGPWNSIVFRPSSRSRYAHLLIPALSESTNGLKASASASAPESATFPQAGQEALSVATNDS
jgi:hypothetical protein